MTMLPTHRSFNVSSIFLLSAVAFLTEGVYAASMKNNVLVARQGTTTNAPSPTMITPVPIFTFSLIDQAVTCQPVRITWFTTERQGIELTLSNIGVDQSPPPPPLESSTSPSSLLDLDDDTHRRRHAARAPAAARPAGLAARGPNDFTAVLATNYDPRQSGSSFTWNEVIAPPGWYVIFATLPNLDTPVVSDNFYIHQGTDTSCLAVLTTTTSNTDTQTNTSPPSASSTTVTSPTASDTTQASPVGASSSNSSISVGAIIGIVFAVIALISVGILFWLWLHRRQRAGGSHVGGGSVKSGGGGGGNELGQNRHHRWNGLSSVDSRNALGGMGVGDDGKEFGGVYGHSPHGQRGQHERRPSQADSLGTMKYESTEEGGTILGGVEKLSTNGGHHEFPTTGAAHGRSPFDDSASAFSASLPVLYRNQTHSTHGLEEPAVPGATMPQRSYSASTATTAYSYSADVADTHPTRTTLTSAHGRRPSYPGDTPTRHSSDSSTRPNLNNNSKNNNTYPPAPASRSLSSPSSSPNLSSSLASSRNGSPGTSPSITTPATAYSASAHASDNHNNTNIKDVSKQSNRQSIGGRKRKPVPVYDPNAEFGSVTPQPSIAQLQPPTPTTPSSSIFNGASGHSGSGTANTNPGGNGAAGLPSPAYPQLSHKSSFGPGGFEGKQLHYLIPDMPLEQKDGR